MVISVDAEKAFDKIEHPTSLLFPSPILPLRKQSCLHKWKLGSAPCHAVVIPG